MILHALFLVAILFLHSPALAATLVQTATGDNSCGTSTTTFAVAVTNGNSVLVALTVDGSSIPTPSDGTNTYTQIVSDYTGTSSAIYRATNVTGAPSSVSVTSGSCTAIVAYEVAGLATGDDGTNSGTGTGTSVTTNSVTTTGGGILISVMGHATSGTITPTGSGWTQGYEYEPYNTMNINSERQLSASAGTFTDTWTVANSAGWSAVIAAFKDVSGGGGSAVPSMMMLGVGK